MAGETVAMLREEGGRYGGRRSVLAAGLVFMALVASLPAGTATPLHAGGRERPTRADLAAERRRLARLESEYALASTRKPYIVLDLASGAVRYRLMGMTMREIPLGPVDVSGLIDEDGAEGVAAQLAGIFTMTEKEGDPRLNPLSPEQVEEGADDENVAAVFPPEVPKKYRVSFRQPVAVVVTAGESGDVIKGIHGWLRAVGARLFGRRDEDDAALRVAFRLEPAVATEFWRSIIPDQRWLVLPPEGLALPPAGQEPPPKPKPPRKPPTPPVAKPKMPEPEEGVPFQIPPPIEPPGPDGEDEPPAPPVSDTEDEPPAPPSDEAEGR